MAPNPRSGAPPPAQVQARRVISLSDRSACVSHAADCGNGGPAPGPSAPQGQAQLSVLGQYIKDFSFENPNAPRSLAPNQTQPAINIQINVSAQQLAQTDYEISLKLEGKAESAGTVLFAFDLTFAGVFRVQNVPAETLQPI